MTPEGDPREPREESPEQAQGPERDAPPEEPKADERDAPPEEPKADERDARPEEPKADAPERAAAPGEPEEPRRERGGRRAQEKPEVVPGADLEPDLVLEEPERAEGDRYGEEAYAERYATAPDEEAQAEATEAEPAEAAVAEERPRPRTPRELAADARYQATGKRKTSVARVILKPGGGSYSVNGKSLEQFFPRHGLQATARQPLAAAGYESRMDVVARLHGGGVSSQAGALRHGVARALVEADPALRGELKRRGYLTRDPRVKERKKAGLKKARKRPQFSKR